MNTNRHDDDDQQGDDRKGFIHSGRHNDQITTIIARIADIWPVIARPSNLTPRGVNN